MKRSRFESGKIFEGQTKNISVPGTTTHLLSEINQFSSIISQLRILGRLHFILPIGFLDRTLVPILCHCPHYSEVEFSDDVVPGRWNNSLEQAEQVITCEDLLLMFRVPTVDDSTCYGGEHSN